MIVAGDGVMPSASRILGRTVDCDSFQDARRFLLNGGQKRWQIDTLTAGVYRINTALFSVIIAQNAESYEMHSSELEGALL